MWDAWRLIWAPWTLPQAAVRASPASSMRGGVVGWSALMLAATVGLMGSDDGEFYDVETFTRRMIGNLVVAAGVAAMIVLIVLFLRPQEQSATTERDRAAGRVMLLIPWCALAPAWIWGWISLADARGIHKVFGPIAWARSPLLSWIDSPAWIIAIFVTIVLLLRSADKAVARILAGDRCVACGYRLDGLVRHRCPECGRDFSPAQIARAGTRS